ncbi:MAG: hypothetical protein DF168_01923 [Candidatus Moanabacter tarae]|uniref:Uncharacterized protein n=1 Tax=Candidatus Moanibacter tarae TaxID=2200854 RepID=A0A2Z4AJU8_9BACT|nr:MAG: hypothetical protein DF168_01923 [Candidatus Moanabacter tarae]|tara:strand:- start:25011 stop:25319 length:309 start_codon:yes stop_codon:yes gene_type:complete
MEQDDVKAQARAQQETMDAKMRAVRESIAQQKAEKRIDSTPSPKISFDKQKKRIFSIAIAIIIIQIIVNIWVRLSSPDSDEPYVIEEGLEGVHDVTEPNSRL